MIQSLSDKYKKHIAWPLLLLFYLQFISPVLALGNVQRIDTLYYTVNSKKLIAKAGSAVLLNKPASPNLITDVEKQTSFLYAPDKVDIGGPLSPEASTFHTVNSDKLVNLFTGDFSYSIPLLDVGGYPVNLFYNGGIGMDQEASWVGLGWNINPGAVSRNMRGIPDDFNGDDLLIQEQNVRPNRTFGAEAGIDLEIFGLKTPKIGI
ncbi:MAG: hypothetical protein HY305_03025, partial [Sphingobacteriales bacterium]|nr:hypothetical protein [Sphingobacteriales bacterium]